jgi:hypothetical protein
VNAGRLAAPLVGVTMSLHKLSAGHGYDYLIRQVAALDATHRARTDLASYYAERGACRGFQKTPGQPGGRTGARGGI